MDEKKVFEDVEHREDEVFTEETLKELSNSQIAAGDIVNFKGGPHYKSSNAATASGSPPIAGPAKVTKVSKKGKHPYHVVHTNGTSSVYGWVDGNLLEKVNAKADTFNSYLVRVTVSVLNVRKGPGMNYAITTTIRQGEVYTIVGEQDGWGKLKSGAGWIYLRYTLQEVTP